MAMAWIGLFPFGQHPTVLGSQSTPPAKMHSPEDVPCAAQGHASPAVPALTRALEDSDATVRNAAIRALKSARGEPMREL